MALFIGSTQLSQEDTDRGIHFLINQILDLPANKVHPRSVSHPIKEEQVWLSHEQEILFASSKDLEKAGISYIGTKNVVQCIAVFIKSDDTCILIHVNTQGKFSLGPIIEQLKPKGTLQVFLAGGTSRLESYPQLVTIMRALLDLVKQFNCDIRIEQPFLWSRNQAIPQSTLEYHFDRVFRKACLAYKQRFNEPIPKDWLKDFSVESFYQEDPGSLPQSDIEQFVELLFKTRPVTDNSTKRAIYYLVAQLFPETIDPKTRFLQLMNALFSKSGRSIVQSRFNPTKTCLKNFVFSINTGEIYSIPLAMPMPHENYRSILPLVSASYPSYSFSQQPMLPLPPAFLEKCNRFVPQIQKTIYEEGTTLRTMMNEFNAEADGLIEMLFEFIQSSDYELAKLACFHEERAAFYRDAITDYENHQYQKAIEKYQLLILAMDISNEHDSQECTNYYSNMAASNYALEHSDEIVSCIEEAPAIKASLSIQNSTQLEVALRATVIQSRASEGTSEEPISEYQPRFSL